jgi:DNA-binding transcriptional LysR family regulator
MNLKHYEAFYWIGRLGSFHAAARQLGVSQAAISARVREAEEGLGLSLFERVGRGAVLTPKGQELLPYAAQFVALSAEVQQRIGTRDALSGRVRFGATSIHAVTWLPSLVDRISRSYPGLTLEVAVDSSETLRAGLDRGQLDVAVVAGPLEGSRLYSASVGQVSNIWVASPRLNLPMRPVSPRELAAWPIISDRPGTLLHALMLEWFRQDNAEPQRNHSASHLPTRLHLAKAGLGVAIASHSAAEVDLASGNLVRIDTTQPPPSLTYSLACAISPPSLPMRVVMDAAASLIAQKGDLNGYYAAASRPDGTETENMIEE